MSYGIVSPLNFLVSFLLTRRGIEPDTSRDLHPTVALYGLALVSQAVVTRVDGVVIPPEPEWGGGQGMTETCQASVELAYLSNGRDRRKSR